MHQRSTVYITAPQSIEVRTESLPAIKEDEVLVKTLLTSISAGSEGLVYRGNVGAGNALDATLGSLDGTFDFPVSYGYAAVGRVMETGPSVADEWLGRRVFAFHPHTSHFTASPDALLPLPDDVSNRQAAFLPNMETAVTLMMDGKPMIGEQVVVMGQGVVGLLVTALLGRHPIAKLTTVEPLPTRREWAVHYGADAAVPPDSFPPGKASSDHSADDTKADLVYELSGQPDVLNAALDAVGYEGRIVIGSWYGTKRAPIDLGTRFHRNRIHLISSQVSTIASEHQGRWTESRRLQTALDILRTVDVEPMISHTYPVQDAPNAFQQIDEHPATTLQVLLEYPT